MSEVEKIAIHLSELVNGGNWTDVNLREQLKHITFEQAVAKPPIGNNTLAALAYHMGYYAKAIGQVLDGFPLTAKDKYSFDHQPITKTGEWVDFRVGIVKDFQALILKIKKLDEAKLDEPFTKPEYGTYHRNLWGLIEHTHYHLGQMALLRKGVT